MLNIDKVKANVFTDYCQTRVDTNILEFTVNQLNKLETRITELEAIIDSLEKERYEAKEIK